MKRTLFLMMVSLLMLTCGEKSNTVTAKVQSGQVKDFVEVLSILIGLYECYIIYL